MYSITDAESKKLSCVKMYNFTICSFGKKLLSPKFFTHPEKVYTLQCSGCDTACLNHSMSRGLPAINETCIHNVQSTRQCWDWVVSQFHGMFIRIFLHIEIECWKYCCGENCLDMNKNHLKFSVSCEKIFKEQLKIEKSYAGILNLTLFFMETRNIKYTVFSCRLYWIKKQLTTTRGFYNMAHAREIFFIFWTFCMKGLSCLEGCVNKVFERITDDTSSSTGAQSFLRFTIKEYQKGQKKLEKF